MTACSWWRSCDRAAEENNSPGSRRGANANGHKLFGRSHSFSRDREQSPGVCVFGYCMDGSIMQEMVVVHNRHCKGRGTLATFARWRREENKSLSSREENPRPACMTDSPTRSKRIIIIQTHTCACVCDVCRGRSRRWTDERRRERERKFRHADE